VCEAYQCRDCESLLMIMSFFVFFYVSIVIFSWQQNDETYISLLQLAEESLPSLCHHVCLDVVDACVTLASFVYVTTMSLSQLSLFGRNS